MTKISRNSRVTLEGPFSELNARDVAAAMSAEQRAELGASLGFVKHDLHGPAQERAKALAKAVAEDPECSGKADLALTMIADDSFAMVDGEGLVTLLRKMPVGSAAVNSVLIERAEAAAREEMKAALAQTANSQASAIGGAASSSAASSASVWDRAIASVSGGKSK